MLRSSPRVSLSSANTAKLLHGEPASSWLLRIAHSNGLSVQSLLQGLGLKRKDAFPRGAIGRAQRRSHQRSSWQPCRVLRAPNRSKLRSNVGTDPLLGYSKFREPRERFSRKLQPLGPTCTEQQYCPECSPAMISAAPSSEAFLLYSLSDSRTLAALSLSALPRTGRLRPAATRVHFKPFFAVLRQVQERFVLSEALHPFSPEQVTRLATHQALNLKLLNHRFQTDHAPFQCYSEFVQAFIQLLSPWQTRQAEPHAYFIAWLMAQSGLTGKLAGRKLAPLTICPRVSASVTRAQVMLMIASLCTYENLATAHKRMLESETSLMTHGGPPKRLFAAAIDPATFLIAPLDSSVRFQRLACAISSDEMHYP